MRSPTNSPGVYMMSSPSGGEYVGSAINIRLRWHGHKAALRGGRHKNSKLQNAWNKYGEDTFQFHILIICRVPDLLIYEQIAIDAIRPRYNICLVAGNSLGVKRSDAYKLAASIRVTGTQHTEETKTRRSAALMGHVVSPETREKLAAQRGWKHSAESLAKMAGRVVSDETRAKMSANLIGKTPLRLGLTHNQETRDKISAKLKGRPLSEETRAKMSAARAGRTLSQNHRASCTKLWVVLDEQRISLVGACDKTGIAYATVMNRVYQQNMTVQQAIEKGPGGRRK